MSYKITKIKKFMDGKLHVYKRDDSRFWLCRYFAEGKYKVKSTGEERLHEAKEVAETWYLALRHNQTQNIPIHQKSFGAITDEYLEYQKTLVKNYERSIKAGSIKKTGRITGKYRTARQAKDYVYRINALNKFFGQLEIGNITRRNIEDYVDDRMKLASMTTVRYDLTALSLVLQYAERKEYITNIPKFPKLNVSSANPRPAFTKKEWNILIGESNKRIKKARGARQRNQRQQLHDFMIFSVHTGMRVNEVLATRYMDCKVEKKKTDKNGKNGFLLVIKNVKGKNDIREVVGLVGAVRVYERLKERNKHELNDLLFPQHHRDQLNNLLKEVGMKTDTEGNVRNARSFRSTYIMFRLIWGTPIKDIATNCGNSTNVIDKYYAKYITSKDMKERLSDYPQ
jgi:integrase